MESSGNVENVRRTRARNDRILPETPWVSAIIALVLVGVPGVFGAGVKQLRLKGI